MVINASVVSNNERTEIVLAELRQYFLQIRNLKVLNSLYGIMIYTNENTYQQ